MTLAACDIFVSQEQRLKRAAVAEQNGDYGVAIIELRNIIKDRPDNVDARMRLVNALLMNTDLTSARAAAEPLWQVSSKSADMADLLARLEIATGNSKTLLERIEKLPLAPQKAKLRHAQASLLLGNVDGAQAEFDAALALDNADIEARLGRIQMLVARNKISETMDELRDLLSQSPSAAKAWLMQGVLLAREVETVGAVQSLVKANELAKGQLRRDERIGLLAALAEQQLVLGDISAATTSSTALSAIGAGSLAEKLTKAQLAFAKKDYDAAAAGLHDYVEKQPDNPSARVLFGKTLLSQNKPEQAEQQYLLVVTQRPQDIAAAVALADLRLQRGDAAKALEALLPVVPLVSMHLGLRTTLDTTLNAAATNAEQFAAVQQLLAKRPHDDILRILTADIQLRANHIAPALVLLREEGAVQAEPMRVSLLLSAIARQQNVEAAQREATNLVRSRDRDASVLRAIGNFFLQQSQLPVARDWLARALAKAPTDRSLRLELAAVQLHLANLAAAEEHIDAALAANPRDVQALLMKAECAERRQDLPEAERALQAAQTYAPWNPQPRLTFAAFQIRAGRITQAEETLTQVRNLRPNQANVHGEAGKLLLAAGRYSQAAEAFTAAAKLQPQNVFWWTELAESELAAGRAGEARKATDHAIELRADDIAAWRVRAMIELKANNKPGASQAVKDYRNAHLKAKAATPANAQLNSAADSATNSGTGSATDSGIGTLEGDIFEAEVAMQVNDYPVAAAAFDRALQIVLTSKLKGAERQSSIAIRAAQARRLGGLPKPYAPLEQWLTTYPQDTDVRLALGEMYQSQGDDHRAAQEYERAVALRPNSAAAQNNLAWVYFILHDKRAEQTAKRAFDLAPKVPAVADTYGWILAQSGNVQSGLALIKQAAERASDQPEIQYHYAWALSRSGAASEAIERLEATLKANPSFASSAAAKDLLTELTRAKKP